MSDKLSMIYNNVWYIYLNIYIDKCQVRSRKDSGLQIVDLPQKDSQSSATSYPRALQRNKGERTKSTQEGKN